MRLHSSLIIAGLILASGPAAMAAVIDVDLPGTTRQDDWTDLTAMRNPGYPGFPGTAGWTTPIASDQAGATYTKTAGGGFPAGQGIYIFSGTEVPNTYGGSFAVRDESPAANLQTIVFQIEVTEAHEYDFLDEEAPTLTLNGGMAAPATPLESLIAQVESGIRYIPETEQEVPIFVNTWLFQWDLAGFAGPVTSFSIDWDLVEHTVTHSMRLTQSSVPEPASVAIAAASGIALLMRRRRR